MVNAQYITVCKSAYKNAKDGDKFAENVKLGDRLSISLSYFSQSSRLLKKVAFMLTHTLWRKLFPTENDHSHSACNNIVFEYLCREQWPIAAEFSEFALTKNMVADCSEILKKIRIINHAIALKHSNKNRECIELIKSIDWQTSIRDFRLAAHLLCDEREKAYDLMTKIGAEGDLLTEFSYRSWPLFYQCKEDPIFIEIFEKIYGTKYYSQAIDVTEINATPTKRIESENSIDAPPTDAPDQKLSHDENSEKISQEITHPPLAPVEIPTGKSAAHENANN